MRILVNHALVETDAWAMKPALDFIRGDLGLKGSKEGCREGDCGACAVIVGARLPDGDFSYRASPSCIMALGELEGCHLLTIEGLGSSDRLSPVMRALAEANGSQCGFCSPGFVIAFTAYLANCVQPVSLEGAVASVEGNFCRCTGYGSIKRAAGRLAEEFASLPAPGLERIDALVAAGVLPASTAAFARGVLLPREAYLASPRALPLGLPLGGGSDFYVKTSSPDPQDIPAFTLLRREGALTQVRSEGDALALGAALSWREFFSDPQILGLVPGLPSFEYLFASPLVRERATIGGNIANASPVGDISAVLLALGVAVRLSAPGRTRVVPLDRLFLGYKKLDLSADEIIETILIPAKEVRSFFNFEKVSKRERLDIAAVNSAASFELEGAGKGARIRRARISAGGVAAFPLYLGTTSSWLAGKPLEAATALGAARMAASECSPIDDVRGAAEYRRSLLERLVLGHFLRLFRGPGLEEAWADLEEAAAGLEAAVASLEPKSKKGEVQA